MPFRFCEILGAIEADTDKYVLPSQAERLKIYKCVSCKKPLIFRRGEVKRAHFAHKADTACSYFDHPSEGEIHKAAKEMLAKEMRATDEYGAGLSIYAFWNCKKLNDNGYNCGTFNPTTMKFNIETREKVITEWKSPDGSFIADIALFDAHNNLTAIIEIKDTHRTLKQRQEPWFEFSAKDVLEALLGEEQEMERIVEGFIDLECIRQDKRRYCPNCESTEMKEMNNIPRLHQRKGNLDGWKQEKPCVRCGKKSYSPTLFYGWRALCKMCQEPKWLKETYGISSVLNVKEQKTAPVKNGFMFIEEDDM